MDKADQPDEANHAGRAGHAGHAAIRALRIAVTFAFVLRAFDGAYAALRATASVAPDNLIYYDMLLTWWRHGDPPTGYTLVPSPYFIDLLLQLPIAILAPDFERFSYFLALTFCMLIAGSLFAVSRIVLEGRARFAGIVAALAVIGYYALAPSRLIAQVFVQNHTSEIFSTLGALVVLHWMHEAPATRRRLAALLYALAVACGVASSPFFIATYCIPAAVGVLALLGTPVVSWRRLVVFLALTVAGAVAGLVAIAWINEHVWPIRGDAYPLTVAQSWLAFRETVSLPEVLPFTVATVLAAVACAGSVAALRVRKSGHHRAVFYAAFVAATVVSCSAMPVLRRAFSNPYEIRYLQLPFLLAAHCYAGALACGVAALATRARARLDRSPPRWTARAALVGSVAAAILAIATLRGPLTMFAKGSKTADAIACFAAAEKEHGLEDGLGVVWVARYFNAARHSADWHSRNVLIQMDHWHPPSVSGVYNNLFWFKDGYRHGEARVNFLATHLFSDASLDLVRARIGAPDRVVTCPVPSDSPHVDGRQTFDIWVWKQEPAVARLTEMVLLDNTRSPFSPAIGAKAETIDVAWGMHTGCGEDTLVDHRRVWRRGAHCDGPFVFTRPLFVPSGRYRVDIDFAATPIDMPNPGFVTVDSAGKRLSQVPLLASTRHVALEVDVHNRGGTTSGDTLMIAVHPADADALEVSGMTVTQVKPEAIDPFRVFRE